jgi:hypothetical protein
LIPVDGEDKTTSFFVTRIFPFGLDALLEILNGVDPAPFVLD